MIMLSFIHIGFTWYFPHVIELEEDIEVRLTLLRGFGNYLFCWSLKYYFQM